MLNIKDLRTLKSHLEKGRFNYYDAIPFLSVIRNELELSDKKSNYKWLNLLCNWSLHPSISTSMVAVEIVQLFLDSLIKYDLGEDNSVKSFNDEIINNIRNDLIQFLHVLDIDVHFLKDDSVFFNIFSYFLSVIYDRPLEIPSISYIEKKKSRIKRVSRIEGSIKKITNKECMVTGLKIKIDSNKLYWQLSTSIYILISIPLGYLGKRFMLHLE